VYTRSETSSLDDIAWGLVYPDFLRVFLPLFRRVDRGVGEIAGGITAWEAATLLVEIAAQS
jgi:hypothetical protein